MSGLVARPCRQAGTAGTVATPLHQDDVMPFAVDVAKAFAIADFAKSDFCMQRAARGVRGEDLGLERPIACGLGLGRQTGQQS